MDHIFTMEATVKISTFTVRKMGCINRVVSNGVM